MLMLVANSPIYQFVCLASAVIGVTIYGIYRLWVWLFGKID